MKTKGKIIEIAIQEAIGAIKWRAMEYSRPSTSSVYWTEEEFAVLCLYMNLIATRLEKESKDWRF